MAALLLPHQITGIVAELPESPIHTCIWGTIHLQDAFASVRAVSARKSNTAGFRLGPNHKCRSRVAVATSHFEFEDVDRIRLGTLSCIF